LWGTNTLTTLEVKAIDVFDERQFCLFQKTFYSLILLIDQLMVHQASQILFVGAFILLGEARNFRILSRHTKKS